MPTRIFRRQKLGRIRLRPSVIAAGIALAVTIAAGVFADLQNRTVQEQHARAQVREQLSLIRAKLEGNINANFQLVRGLVAVISANPNLDQRQFDTIAEKLIGKHSQLRNIAGAPDLVIRFMYPMAGNEKAVGLDYRKNAAQRDAALRALRLHQMVLAGPVNLLQGGQGFIGRYPVFYTDAEGREKPWGLVSAVVDIERLYAASGIGADSLSIDVAIAGRDATGENGDVFHGSAEVFAEDPVLADVTLPSGSWQIAAIPKGGWPANPANTWQIRLYTAIAGLLIVLPIAVAGRLYDQRQAYLHELRRRKNQLKKLSHRLKLALDTSKIGVWELNLDSQELTWDARMKELYGIPADSDPKEYDVWSNCLHEDDRERAEAEFQEAIETDGKYSSEFRVVLPNGAVRWIRAIGAVRNEADGPRYILGVNWDVSADFELKTRLLAAKRSAETRNKELEDARAQMEHNSLHDSLTGLPNRRFLDQILMHGKEGLAPTALMHIDLDRFKHINDTLGHAAGDRMLVHAATTLKASIRSDDFVARIGGDEFVIVTMSEISESQLSALAKRIIEEMRQPVKFENHECRFGVSIGIAVNDDCKEVQGKHLLVNADIALYRAKRNGRNRHEFFTDMLKSEIVRTKQITDDILNGLERQEFVPYFQPQFDADTLEIVGVEALARWNHPTEGLQTPEVFLRIADELSMAPMIDRTILEQSLWQRARWRSAGLDIPKLSVNVSAGRLQDADLIESLDGLSIEPNTLSFELLESIFLDDGNEEAARNIEALAKMGIDIEIDDFGTGYASIVSLLQLRPTRLKIDRRLVLPITESDSQCRLVASIIDIGQSLGIEVIAEGVETREHADMLRGLGCSALQGFAFAPPMPAAEFLEFVRNESWRKVA